MSKQNSWKRLLIGGAAATAVVAGIAAFTLAPTSVSAQDAPADAPSAEDGGRRFGDRRSDGRGRAGLAGMMGHGNRDGEKGEYLEAELAKLGITAEQLEAAKEEVKATAIAQLVADGVITQEQADQMAEGEGRFGGRFGGHGGPKMGHFGHGDDAIDHDALLAEALDITVEELQAAKDAAREAALADAIAEGDVTEEQAEQMRAMHVLRDYIDHEAILAGALGVTVEELQTAHEEGTVRDLFEDLDRDQVKEAMQAGFEAAVAEAVADGVITPEQADALESGEGFGGRGGFFSGRGGHGGRDGHGFPGMRPGGVEQGDGDGESNAPRSQRSQSQA